MSDTAPRTRRERKAALGPYGVVGQALNEADDRFGISKGGRVFMDKIFPDHWSFMLGEIALYSFVVLIATGVFLSLYFIPSTALTVYHCTKGMGCYRPLVGQRVSEAYASTVNISFAVRAGLLMRQMHHWAADVFVGSIVVHMGRIFFTGAFRKPRETNWIIGTLMLIMAILNGFIGYSLPDDLISGTGLRIGYSIVLSIPFVGSYLAFFLFGGPFPGDAIIPRFFLIHILIIPAVIAGLLAAHLGLLVRQKHTQFAGPGRTEHNVVGSPMFPTFMAKTTGFLFMVTGGLALLGGFAQINPIWQFGAYTDVSKISYAVQPDWYMGWLDGALRIMPAWEWTGWGHTLPWEVFFPAVILPGLVFNVCFLWPLIERKLTGDNEIHNLLERPRDRPKRTAFGAGFFAFVACLFAASSTDVLANYFSLSLNLVLWAFRIIVIVVPVIVGLITWRICVEIRHGGEDIGKRKRAVIVTRSAEGGYSTAPSPPRPGDEPEELHPEPVPVHIDLEPVPAGPGGDGNGSGVRTVNR
jgi:ubiquinol-cytochrome c reductase cytochrome b subunit